MKFQNGNARQANLSKGTATTVEVLIPHEMYDMINNLVIKHNDNIANTTRTLMLVALKYNFTPELDYIPCVERSEPIPHAMRRNRKARNKYSDLDASTNNTFLIAIAISPKLMPKLNKLTGIYSSTISETVRMLITIALQYNYKPNLTFQKAEPIPTQNKNKDNNDTYMPVIILDYFK